MAYTVDLGSDTFYSTKLDLDLTLYTSVEILVPANATGVRSAEGLKNTLYSGTIWVDQLPQLRLNVYVSAESTLNHPLTILASQMGDALCNSQAIQCVPTSGRHCNQGIHRREHSIPR
ncbi:hypothetical protein BDV26DRAFT_301110 [Aspergillus bertholletiae]|uniref:Uncharacterized protein n=1 Tax=Aspergillus bertholletiae TaxID=1226010 RepID=A0A5N7AUA6_9EURO|nr:hypothetical protein BDV26DRAFT_301110 [Aspergillus bertholletiae]